MAAKNVMTPIQEVLSQGILTIRVNKVVIRNALTKYVAHILTSSLIVFFSGLSMGDYFCRCGQLSNSKKHLLFFARNTGAMLIDHAHEAASRERRAAKRP
jgi:hypothetical protein